MLGSCWVIRRLFFFFFLSILFRCGRYPQKTLVGFDFVAQLWTREIKRLSSFFFFFLELLSLHVLFYGNNDNNGPSLIVTTFRRKIINKNSKLHIYTFLQAEHGDLSSDISFRIGIATLNVYLCKIRTDVWNQDVYI